MNSDPKEGARTASASTDKLPPLIYVAIVGLVAWMALAAWGFAGPGYADVALTVMTGFLALVIAIPFILWRVSLAHGDHADQTKITLRDWASGQFETWQERVKGTNAAVEILLPVVAAAAGMTAFAIVFHYAAAHAVV